MWPTDLWWFGDDDLDDVWDEPGQVAADEDADDRDWYASQPVETNFEIAKLFRKAF